MAKGLMYLRGVVTADEAAQLDRAVERGACSRAWLVGQILRHWLNDPRRTLPADPARGQLRDVPPQQRDQVKQREGIVQRWKAAIASGRRSGMTASESTDRYMVNLNSSGIKISRRTLFNWRLRYEGNGLIGLVDRRYMCHAAQQFADRQRRKAAH